MDLIACGRIAHINLTEVHRQAKKSAIKMDSIKIWKGEHVLERGFVGVETRGELQDLTYDITAESKTTADRVIFHFKKLL